MLDVAGNCFPPEYFDMIERRRRQINEMKADEDIIHYGNSDLKVLFAKTIFGGHLNVVKLLTQIYLENK